MTNQDTFLPPLSEVARLDAEISVLMHKVSSGRGAGDEMGKVASLIRERANATLPAGLVERRIQRGLPL